MARKQKQIIFARRTVIGRRSKLQYACKICKEKFQNGYDVSYHIHKKHGYDLDEATRQQLVAFNNAQVIRKPQELASFVLRANIEKHFKVKCKGKTEEEVIKEAEEKLNKALNKILPGATITIQSFVKDDYLN